MVLVVVEEEEEETPTKVREGERYKKADSGKKERKGGVCVEGNYRNNNKYNTSAGILVTTLDQQTSRPNNY